MHRLFVALSLPEIVVDALTQLQSGLGGARWRAPEQFHLTLQFVGNVDRQGLADALDALSGCAAPRFSLTLSGCGMFGGERARSVWAGVASSPELDHLQAKTGAALRRFGLKIDKRKFTPHVTLAYLSGGVADKINAYTAGHNMFRCGPFPVREFHLYESCLGGENAHYEILETYRLTARHGAQG